MKKLILAIVSSAAFAGAASAADLAARPYTKAPPAVAAVMTWTGFYVGVQGGGAWGSSDEVFFGAPNNPTFLGTQKYDTSGGFAGGVAGFNWQSGAFVLGIEADYHWADISGRSSVINVGPANDTYFTHLRSFGDIKGRLGYAAGPTLWFVSGGAAVGDIQHRYDDPVVPSNTFITNDTRWGYTVGAGVEYKFAPSWSAKLEYNYIDLGKSTINYTAPPTLNRSEWDDTFHTVKAGVNYHFNWGGPVVAKY